MAKRLFQTLDEMNVHDGENGTTLVGVCSSMISADMGKAGTRVTMGAPKEVIQDLLSGKTLPILLVINKDEYFKRENIPANDPDLAIQNTIGRMSELEKTSIKYFLETGTINGAFRQKLLELYEQKIP